MNIGYIAHAINTNPCDHELLTLSVNIPSHNTPDGYEHGYKLPRKQFLTTKLKDKKIKKAYQTSLATKSKNTMQRCPAGKYSSTKAASCMLCPRDSFTTSMGATVLTDCKCNAGTHGPDGGPCFPCSVRFVCEGGAHGSKVICPTA